MSDNSLPGKKVVVIGAGPAGLTAAYQLSRAGVESVVLEKDRVVGGISRTISYKDYYFDLGGHRFFTKFSSVESMWQEVLGKDLLRRDRLSRIYYNHRFFYYPLRPFNALIGLGPYKSVLILMSYLYSQLFPFEQEETFEEWVSNRFGKHLFKTFFETYTEKVWGMPCSEIRADWAAQRIKGLSLISVVKNALVGTNHNGGNKEKVIKTLIEQFDYPKLGPGMMWQAVAEGISGSGSQVLLESELKKIVWSGNKVEAAEYRKSGATELISGTDFICSIPMQEAVRMFEPEAPQKVLDAANGLRYRDFLTVALIIDKPDLFPDNWIYVHDPDVKVGRIQNFKNWSPYMVPDPNKTCLGLEYFCFEGDEFWKTPNEELIESAKEELDKMGLAKSADVEDGKVVRVPKAYPIYDANYRNSVKTIREFVEGFTNLQLIGRNGMHKYNNQDHSMLTAMLACENILGADHDLWQVNEESEYHEEITRQDVEPATLDRLFRGVFARMDQTAFATAIGTVSGLFVFFATLFLILKGDKVVVPYLELLNQYFFGYSVTIAGAFVGLAYSFFWGFLFGWLLAYLRNLFLGFFIYRLKRKVELMTFRDFLDHF